MRYISTRRLLTHALLPLVGVALVAAAAVATTPTPSTIEEDTWAVSTTNVVVGVGVDGAFLVTIKAKGDHKVNDEYPTKLTVATEGAVDLPKPVMKRGDATFEGKTAVFKVPVKATAKGQFPVTGELKFSVCSDTACYIKKAAITSQVTGS